jgi:hypothetical protein
MTTDSLPLHARDDEYDRNWLAAQDELDALTVERIEEQKLAQHHVREDEYLWDGIHAQDIAGLKGQWRAPLDRAPRRDAVRKPEDRKGRARQRRTRVPYEHGRRGQRSSCLPAQQPCRVKR